MKTQIITVAGFLGAGKTTLIQYFLQNFFKPNDTILIENDFGAISIDATVFAESGFQVKSIESGCICCSLAGNFVLAIKELIEVYQPKLIIIEPSGVGKLSDIKAILQTAEIQELFSRCQHITVVDTKRCAMYLENFGDFFIDQIKEADHIFLSRTDLFPEKIESGLDLCFQLNQKVKPLTHPGGFKEIFEQQALLPASKKHVHHNACHTHLHSADHFESITLYPPATLKVENLKTIFQRLFNHSDFELLRAKGFIIDTNQYFELQYIPGELKTKKCSSQIPCINLIGRNLKKHEKWVKNIFFDPHLKSEEGIQF